MKKIMILVAAMMMAVTVDASNKSIENAVETPNRMAPFSEVNVNVPSRIRVVQGEDYGVMINGTADYDSTMLTSSVTLKNTGFCPFHILSSFRIPL